MERRRTWMSAPVELRAAVTVALVCRSVALVRHRRRTVAALAGVGATVPVVAATAAATWPAVWVVYAAAMSVALGKWLLDRFAPYQQSAQLFDRGAWLGPVDARLLRRLLAAGDESLLHPAELAPAPPAVPLLADALVDLEALGELPGQVAAAEPWRTLTVPYLEAVAPGLAPAAHALATTPRYARRPLREAASVARRTYARTGA